MFRRTVDLFTADENAVLADWFRTKMRSFSHGEPQAEARSPELMKSSPRLSSAATSSRSSCRVTKSAVIVWAIGGVAFCAIAGGACSLIAAPAMVSLKGALSRARSLGRSCNSPPTPSFGAAGCSEATIIRSTSTDFGGPSEATDGRSSRYPLVAMSLGVNSVPTTRTTMATMTAAANRIMPIQERARGADRYGSGTGVDWSDRGTLSSYSVGL